MLIVGLMALLMIVIKEMIYSNSTSLNKLIYLSKSIYQIFSKKYKR